MSKVYGRTGITPMLMTFTDDITRRRLKVQLETGLPQQTRTGAFLRDPGSDETNIEEVQAIKAWVLPDRGGEYFESEGSEDSRIFEVYMDLKQRAYNGGPSDPFTPTITDTDVQMGDWLDFTDNGNDVTGLVIYVNVTDHIECRVRVMGKQGET